MDSKDLPLAAQWAEIPDLVQDAKGERVAVARTDHNVNALGARIVELPPLVLGEPATVRGQVIGDGQPLAGAQVSLSTTFGSMEELRPGFELGQAETNERGQFVVKLVPSGMPLQIEFTWQRHTPGTEFRNWQGTEAIPRSLPPLKPGSVTELPVISLRSAE